MIISLLLLINNTLASMNNSHDAFIKDLISALPIEKKIGQLFMVGAVVDVSMNDDLIALKPYRIDSEYIKELIAQYHIGGVIWLGRGIPELQKERANELREYAKQCSSIPFWFGQDLEPSFLARFGFGLEWHAREIGQKDDVNDTFAIGKKIGEITKEYDVQLIFAPVADIHQFEESPITRNRSFGRSGELVVKHAVPFINGMTLDNKKVIPCIKHFPGHGATHRDSHYELLTVDAITVEMLFPFKQLLKMYQNCGAMVGHIAVKDCNEKMPTTFNKLMIDYIKAWNPHALIVTDALDMLALRGFEQKEVKALQAGCHLLLCPIDVPKAINEIKQALADGVLSMDTINNAVEKIVRFKLCH